MSAALREVRLYGSLGERFGRVFRLAVQSPSEAVQALSAVLPGFRAAFLGPDGQASYYVRLGRGRGRVTIDESRKDELVDATAPICLVPAIAGAKRQGVGQTILGAVLVVAGYVVTGLSYGWAAPLGGAMVNAGYAMIVGGVVQMLSPQRKTDTATERDPSYGMDAGAVNTDEAGARVPLAYGRITAGSVRISGGLSTDEMVIGPGGGFVGGEPSELFPQTLPDYMDLWPVDTGAVAASRWVNYES